MKPLYIFLLMFAVFITGLSDGISWALLAIPGLGFVLGLVITFCINATMGVGLLFLLITNEMYHPKFGPIGTIAGLVPPFNFLPVWVGLVGAGIVHDMSKEAGVLGEVTKLADNLQSTKNPLSRARSIMSASKDMERLATGQPPQAANDNEPQTQEAQQPRNLPMNDITPARDRVRNQYAKAA